MPTKTIETVKSSVISHRKALAILGVVATLAYAVPTLTSLGQAKASGGGSGGRSRAGMVVQDAVTKAACSECHFAYPPALLSSSAWSSIMTNLPNHFGEDASLDVVDQSHITAYLTSNAAKRGDAKTLRISELGWFTSEHRGEVSARDVARAKSMSNCVACHKDAEKGEFDD